MHIYYSMYPILSEDSLQDGNLESGMSEVRSECVVYFFGSSLTHTRSLRVRRKTGRPRDKLILQDRVT